MTDLESPKLCDSPKMMETKINNAKAFLLSNTTTSGVNLYEHLVNIIAKTLETRSLDVIEKFDSNSMEEKRAKFTMPPDTIQDKDEILPKTILAHEHKNLFTRPVTEIPDTLEGSEEGPENVLPNLLENAFLFEQAGIGLGREELFRIFLALKQLTNTYKLKSCRLWGKILGIHQSYIIAEVEFKEGEDPLAVNETESLIDAELDKEDTIEEETVPMEDKENAEEDKVPEPDFKPLPDIPMEPNGTGCNKMVYFVCHEPGQSWSRLPEVTPAQIVVARQIRKLLTGDLEAEVMSYPPFPGNESNYLRAQIARITATTIVSPQGYYTFEEDEEEEDEGEGRDHVIVNEEFEGIPVGDLIDPTFSGWVHHTQYILPQGRTSWFNSSQKSSEEEVEEEEDEDDKEEPDEPEPEIGPALLTPLSEDNEVEGVPAWTVHKSSSFVPQYAIAHIHSNLWPGAHAFAVDRKFENIYIGWGQKYLRMNYSPPPPPKTLDEYPSGPEITEAEDPTVEEERALNAARQEAQDAEEEEEESEDLDDDDDD